MIGPSSQISKLLLGSLFLLIIFYIYMDIQLYLRIQNYPLERNYHFLTNANANANTNTNMNANININKTISSTKISLTSYDDNGGVAASSASYSASGIYSSSSTATNGLLHSQNRRHRQQPLEQHQQPQQQRQHYVSAYSLTTTTTAAAAAASASAAAAAAVAVAAPNLPTHSNQLKPLEAMTYESQTWIPCDLNPLCHVTVKAILLDHTNHYLFAPLVKIFDNIVHISRSSWITANMISFFHVGVACLAGRFVACDSLGYRRLGAVMFELRTFLDDLDGHVARVKKNIRGERSEVGTAGYYIDGICDALGCIGLLLGMFVYLKNNPPRRGYLQLPMIDPRANTVVTKLKTSTRKVAKKILIFTGQLLLSSAAWNRYIAVYQDMLERNDVTATQMARQIFIFKTTWFFCVAWLWRLINVHSLLHYVLLSIFCDKLWEFLKAIQYIGYLLLLICICLTEMHLLEAHNFIYGTVINTNITSF